MGPSFIKMAISYLSRNRYQFCTQSSWFITGVELYLFIYEIRIFTNDDLIDVIWLIIYLKTEHTLRTHHLN